MTLQTGKEATETSFKYIADRNKSPEIIHIASHGFYFPETGTSSKNLNISSGINRYDPSAIFRFSENPLLRSGIIMAGANLWWNRRHPDGVDDGTLTAYELSGLNLGNTRLVALSACETGLGDIKGSEGVYGLQRAFKMAGVKYLLMSLWQVPDYQTSELMKLFYTNYAGGMSIEIAFRSSQKSLREKYDPYNWAAFVLIH